MSTIVTIFKKCYINIDCVCFNISIIAFLANFCFNLLSVSCFFSLSNSEESKFLYQIPFRVLKSKFSFLHNGKKMPASSLGFTVTLNTEIVIQDLSTRENVCGCVRDCYFSLGIHSP